MASLAASCSGVPYAFHRSPWRAISGSVFFGPEPPIRIGRCGWTGLGAQTASWKR